MAATKAELRRHVDDLLGDIDSLLLQITEVKRPFIKECRNVLEKLSSCVFAQPFLLPVTGVRGYAQMIAKPMCLSQVRANLPFYVSAEAFVEDMRLIVTNCYTFNGERSQLSNLARELEVAMEDEFVIRLRMPQIAAAEISMQCRQLNRDMQRRLAEVICLYEKREFDGKQCHFVPERLTAAARRAIMQLIRQSNAEAAAAPRTGAGVTPASASSGGASTLASRVDPQAAAAAAVQRLKGGASTPSGSATAAAPAHTFQRPPQAQLRVKRPAPTSDGGPVAPPPPHRVGVAKPPIDDDDDDLFHEVAQTTAAAAAAAAAAAKAATNAAFSSVAPTTAAQVVAPKPLEQNKHQHGFVDGISPMHSPGFGSDDNSDDDDLFH